MLRFWPLGEPRPSGAATGVLSPEIAIKDTHMRNVDVSRTAYPLAMEKDCLGLRPGFLAVKHDKFNSSFIKWK